MLPFIGDYVFFLTSAALGGCLFAIGVALGVSVKRRGCKAEKLEKEQVLGMLADLFRWTSEFAHDVSDYRDVVNKLADSCENNDVAPSELTNLLKDVREATVGVERRLSAAEATLKQHAAQIAAYMSEARTDSLTALPNRRAFDDDLSRRFAEWKRYGGNLSLLLLDIDHFKTVNDQFGHLAGDAVLHQVARVLEATLRESDVVCRFGGEEFAIVLPVSDVFEGCQAARRVREAIVHHTFAYEDIRLNITVSCGVAQADTGDSPSTLLKRSDQALYASKHAGRNCVHWHDGVRCIRMSEPCADQDQVDELSDELSSICRGLRQRVAEVTGSHH